MLLPFAARLTDCSLGRRRSIPYWRKTGRAYDAAIGLGQRVNSSDFRCGQREVKNPQIASDAQRIGRPRGFVTVNRFTDTQRAGSRCSVMQLTL